MSATQRPRRTGAAGSVAALMDQACDEFERAWQQGARPAIADFLAGFEGPDRERLLCELVILDVTYRRRLREEPETQEYVALFPESAAAIEAVFHRLETSHCTEPTLEYLERPEDQEGVVSVSSTFSQLRLHARGGLGEVYRGRDDQLQREVAVKFVLRDQFDSSEACERLRIEAEVTGRLEHPGVVPVYGVGQAPDGRPFYVMRFVEGDTLRQAIEQFHDEAGKAQGGGARRVQLHRLLEHLVAAANAVAYGHNRGVLHRDVKPDNILLGRYGETFLVDWGLAHFVQRDARAKASGEKSLMPGAAMPGSQGSGKGAGTIGYLSPEQVPDSNLPVGPASDVYSLGATLYKLLTGSTAFHWSQGQDVWRRICCGEFPRPRQLNRTCPPALEAICLKAMALRPQDRYPSAQDFAEDLRRWMADEPVAVYRESLAERALRWARRHQAFSLTAIAVAVLLVVMGVLTSLALNHGRAQAVQARVANLRSTAAFAAETFGYEIDQRWRILTEHAGEAELRTLLKAAAGKPPDSPERSKLQNWLAKRFGPVRARGLCQSCSVTDAEGTQLSRDPYDDNTIGKNFRFRSYFHGGPHDLAPEAAATVKPTRKPVLSPVYLSRNIGAGFTVSFTVPIWDGAGDQREPIGILGMAVRVGDIVRRKHRGVALVDLRSDAIGGRGQRGLVLDHPEIQLAKKTAEGYVRVPPELLERFDVLRRLRLDDRRSAGPGEPLRPPRPESLDLRYADPVTSDRLPCLAAFEPVFVSGHEEDELTDIGWLVIVQDRGSSGNTGAAP